MPSENSWPIRPSREIPSEHGRKNHEIMKTKFQLVHRPFRAAALLAAGAMLSIDGLPAETTASKGGAASSTAQSRPNIVFFEVDDLMFRFMGKLGRHFAVTPNMDSLADAGIYFSNAVGTARWATCRKASGTCRPR